MEDVKAFCALKSGPCTIGGEGLVTSMACCVMAQGKNDMQSQCRVLWSSQGRPVMTPGVAAMGAIGHR